MHVDYSNVTVSDAIGNNLHKEQHVNTMHFVKKLFTLYVCLQALMNVGYSAHHISSLTAPGLVMTAPGLARWLE